MNGTSEVKGAILGNIDDRLREIEKCGCPGGLVRAEKLNNLVSQFEKQLDLNEKIFGKLDEIKDAVSNRSITFMVGLLAIGILAGVNIYNIVASLFHLIPGK